MSSIDKQLFWDVDFKELDFKKYPNFIIARILEYGDEKAINWMFDHFQIDQIKETLLTKRGISCKSANYWALILNIPKDKVLCLKKQFQNKPRKTWLR